MIRLRPSPAPIVSVLVLTYQHTDLVVDCLSSLARSVDSDAVPYEVIVLFQQVSREAAEALMKSVEGVRALHVRLNLGFGGGMNFAAKHAKGRYLVFLNDDSAPHPGWLERLVTAAESDNRIGAVGSRIVFTDGTLQEAGGIIWSDGSTMPLGRGERPGSLAFSYVRSVDYTSANGMLVRRDDFERLGGFDERYFPAYYEDTDLCLALRHQLGREIIYEPRSVISHVEAASSPDSDFRAFLFRRNQAALTDKWKSELSAYPAPDPSSPTAVESAVERRRGNAGRVLVIDDRLPDAEAGAGGLGSGFVRARELFEDLRSYSVTVLPTDRRHAIGRNTLADLGVDLVEDDLETHLRKVGSKYDAVVISRPHNFAPHFELIKKLLPTAAVIYDAEALYHKRMWLQASLEIDPARKGLLETQARAMADLEYIIARRVDRLVTISPEERGWLENVEGHAPIEFLPPLLSGVEMSPDRLEGREDAVFVAGWLGGSGSPNVDAAKWYCDEVLPSVCAALPGFRTIVTGKDPPIEVQARSSEAFVLTGFVQSVADLYRGARIAIVPMRVGAGVKNKTMEALQFGVPVVATSVGAEGLELRDGVAADVTDNPREFATRIVSLMTDDALWSQRRRAVETRVRAWESRRVSWHDVLARALATRGIDARHAS